MEGTTMPMKKSNLEPTNPQSMDRETEPMRWTLDPGYTLYQILTEMKKQTKILEELLKRR